MSADEDFTVEAMAVLRHAPASGGIKVADPGEGTITKRAAQKLFVDGMAIIMEEWHGRGVVEGRLRERERLAAILCHRAALGRRDLAMQLALSDTPVDKAIAELEAAPADRII